jgi:hypothetical protein
MLALRSRKSGSGYAAAASKCAVRVVAAFPQPPEGGTFPLTRLALFWPCNASVSLYYKLQGGNLSDMLLQDEWAAACFAVCQLFRRQGVKGR